MILSSVRKISIHSFLLIIILLVSVANRFYGLDRLSLWGDELWVVMESAKGSLLDMFAYVSHNDNHPPGHYFITRYWQMIFGDSDYTIRFPFAVAGVLLVYSTYRIAKIYYSVEAGLIAATLVCVSWQAIYYSQEARANIMVALAVLWTLHHFYQLVFIEENIDIKKMLFLWMAAASACYLHYAGLVFVVCLGIIYSGVLLTRRNQSAVTLGLKLFLPVFVIYVPWLPGLFYQLTHKPAGAWWSAPEWAELYTTFKQLFEFGSQLLPLYQAVFLVSCLCTISFFIDRKKTYQILASFFKLPEQEIIKALQFSVVILLMVLMPALVFFIKSRLSQPVYDSRHFIYAIPLMAMAAGFFISLCFARATVRARNIILTMIILVLIISQNYFNILTHLYTGQHMKPEYRETVQVVLQDTTHATTNEMIIGNSAFFNHYLRRLLQGRQLDLLLTNVQQVDALDALVKAKKPAVFYFLETPETGGRSMLSDLDKTLANHYQPVCRTVFHFAQAIKFSTQPLSSVGWEQLPVCNTEPVLHQ